MLNNQWITEEIKVGKKKKKPRHHWKQKHDDPKPIGCSKSTSKREFYSNIILLQETSQINNLTSYLKQLEKEEQTKPKVSRKEKKNHKDQSRNKWNRDEENSSKDQ